jgi:hypothetical protein
MFQTELVENIKQIEHNSVTFSENRACYAIIRTNMVQPYRPQITI